MKYTDMNSIVTELHQDIAKQTENMILDQLSELVSRGLLVIESTQPVITHEHDFHTNKYILKVNQTCRLVLKDQEYIEKLEKENKELKEKWEQLVNVASEISSTKRGPE